jgi:hypothetical protein
VTLVQKGPESIPMADAPGVRKESSLHHWFLLPVHFALQELFHILQQRLVFNAVLDTAHFPILVHALLAVLEDSLRPWESPVVHPVLLESTRT